MKARIEKEIHSRPPVPLQTPCLCHHLVLLDQETGPFDEQAHLREIKVTARAETLHCTSSHGFVAGENFSVKWEKHSSFSTYTLYFQNNDVQNPAHGNRPADQHDPSLTDEIHEWLNRIPGKVLSYTTIQVLAVGVDTAAQIEAEITGLCKESDHLIGIEANSGAAHIFTDFKTRENGQVSIFLMNKGMAPPRTGRLVQRLTEIETSRHMALLNLPLAKEMGPRLSAIEEKLDHIVYEISRPSSTDQRELLEELTNLAADTERLAFVSFSRFGATEAYYHILQNRLKGLKEHHIEGYCRISTYLERRIEPAVRTCLHTLGRQDNLSKRIQQASQLLRTRVDVNLETQNQQLLHTMSHRVQTQTRLTRMVEGISFVTISYYLIELLNMLLQAISTATGILLPEQTQLVMIPAIMGLVWFVSHKATRRILSSP